MHPEPGIQYSAAVNTPSSIIMTAAWLIGGLALFLYGIDMMGRALRKAAGSSIRDAIGFISRTRFHGVLVGSVTTALLQSSSATTVMIVGFIHAGLLKFPSSIGLILGANIGTTVTAKIVSLDMDDMALPCLGIGFLLTLVARKRFWRQIGLVVMGFGMLFFGLAIMKAAVEGHQEAIRAWLALHAGGDLGGRLMAFFIAVVATAIVQSSGATIGMVVALAAQGVIPDLGIAIPFLLGAGVGTCVTAILACLKSSRPAKRAAVAHLVHNIVGVVITLLLYRFYLAVIPGTASDMAGQIANCHIAIKVVNVIVFLPFVTPFARFVTWLVPGEDKLNASPRYLDYGRVKNAETAFSEAAAEIRRMCGIGSEMVHDAVGALLSGNEPAQERILKQENIIDDLSDVVTDFVFRASQSNLPSEFRTEPAHLLHILADVERIADHAENIVEMNTLHGDPEVRLSSEAREDLDALLELVDRLSAQTLQMLESPTDRLAHEIDLLREDAKDQADKALAGHTRRLEAGECKVLAGVVYDELVMNLRSVADHLRKISRAMKP
ncbi:Na/Pi cotransporter family protein [Verrucomicrobiota bacterium]